MNRFGCKTSALSSSLGSIAVAAALLFGPASAFGQAYTAVLQPHAYQPIPITGGGTHTTLTTSQYQGYYYSPSYKVFTLPFTFYFYGLPYTEVTLMGNGTVSMGSTTFPSSQNSDAVDDRHVFPTASAARHNFIAVWQDKVVCDSSSNQAKTQEVGQPGNRFFVIEFTNCRKYAVTANVNAQLWLGENGEIEVHYGTSSGTWTAAMGVENIDGTDGTSGIGPGGTICTPNCASVPANHKIVYLQGPQLSVTSVTTPPEGFASSTFPVTAEIRNPGNEPALNFTVQFWLDTSPTKTSASIPLGVAPVRQSLQPRQVTTFSLRPTLPVSLGSGPYYIVVEADPDHAVPVAGRGATIRASKPFTIGVPAPNLTALDVVAPGEIQPGSTFDLSWTAANLGNAPAYRAAYQVILSAGETPSASSRVLSIQDVDGRLVDRGWVDLDQKIDQPLPDRLYRDQRRVEKVFLPADVPAGRYYIGVTLDPDLLVFEHERSNNTGVSGATLAKSTTTLAVLTQPTLPTAEAGSPYSIALQAIGGDGSYYWRVSPGSRLPAGLGLEELPAGAREAGLPFVTMISGTPAATGDFEIGLDVTSGALAATRRFELSIVPQAISLNIQTRDLPAAVYESPYRAHLVASGGEPPYVWALATGRLPGGLDFGANGIIEGRPLQDGVFPVTVRVTDSRGVSANQRVELEVLQPARISCGTTALGPFRLAETVDSTIQAGGAPIKYWESEELWHLPAAPGEVSKWYVRQAPPGLVLGSDGRVTGSPTRAGVYDWLVGVKEAPASGTSAKCMIRVEVIRDRNLTITTMTLVDAVIGQRYAAQLEATGGEGDLAWVVPEGEKLPAGLSITPGGLITGTPTGDELAGEMAGNVAFTVRVADSMNRVGTAPLSISLLSSPPGPGLADDETTTTSCQSAGADPSVLAVAAALGLAALRRRRS